MRFVASGKVYLTDGGAEIVWERPADECEAEGHGREACESSPLE